MIEPIRVLVVDDSALMRKAISLMLDEEPDVKVCGVARNGEEAVEKIQSLHPDVVTLDIEMPVMDGLTALKFIMKLHPVPVIMFSSLTTDGAEMTLKALELGAVDFLPKYLPGILAQSSDIRKELVQKVKTVAKKSKMLQRPATWGKVVTGLSGFSAESSPARKRPGKPRTSKKEYELVLIGSSTGGPQTLQSMIPNIQGSMVLPIVIVQHMPEQFTRALAERLNKLSSLQVKEAEHGEDLLEQVVYVAPGGHNLALKRTGRRIWLHIEKCTEESIYRPSINLTAFTAADIFQDRVVGIMLTGMGSDGLEGFKQLKQQKSYIIAQKKDTCVIYGMPRVVIEAGIADAVLSPEEMVLWLNRHATQKAVS